MRRAALLAAVLAACACFGACSGASAPRAVGAPVAAPAPRLVVLVVIDQLPSWSFSRLEPTLRGGLRRLLDRGVYVPAMRLPYGIPLTAPGHATLSTGAPPAVHGVLGNAWYRRERGRVEDADEDAAAPIFRLAAEPGHKPTLDAGSSSVALRVPGLAEALRAGTGGRGQSVAIGLKARAACFVAGQRPDEVLFFEPEAGGMTTSTFYAPKVPPHLVAAAARTPLAGYLTARWEPLDASALRQVTGLEDDAPGEGGEYRLGEVFPHLLERSSAPGKALALTPLGDQLVLEAARDAVVRRGLGADDAPDLLALSLNSHDYTGHSFGQLSWEQVDLLWRLDRSLGELWQFLDERLGADGYAVVLTSDHGATPIVERNSAPGARRIPPEEIVSAAERAFAEVAGPGTWIANLSSSNLYLTAAGRALPAELRARALTAAARALARVPGLAAAGVTADILGPAPGQCAGPPLSRAMCLSAAPGQHGELYVAVAPGSLVTTYATGTHHDALSDDNRQVPLLVMAPGIAPRVEHGPVENLQVAPTVAALLGVAPPAAARAPALVLTPGASGASGASGSSAIVGERARKEAAVPR